jgi:hypothetical protein
MMDAPPALPALPALPAPPALPALPALLTAAAFYTAAFFALTWSAVTRFRTHWFADDFDGLQNVWNLWWVQHAVTVLHQSPWHTDYLHYPYGTSLVAHTLNPFNGFMAIGLSRVMSPAAVHNAIVTFGFVGGGITAFLLAFHLTRAYVPSLLAGFIFTFSSFHFAHAEGHLQLVSLEWIPLFLLLWLKLVAKPTVGLAVGAALVLFLVILCDYYYFLYCVIAAAIILGWWAIRRPEAGSIVGARRVAAFGTFALVALSTSGVLAGALVWSSLRDPLTGAHPAIEFSLDLLSPLVYGGHWRFGALTRPFWIRLPPNVHESSVHLGFSVIALALYAWRNRRALNAAEVGLFAFLTLFFLVLAWGPTPQVAGKAVLGNRAVLPYAWIEAVFPPLAISGVPIRMMVMVTLGAALLASYGFALLLRGDTRHRIAAPALACVMLIEYLPKPIPTLAIPVPDYVPAVRHLPGKDAVLDTVSTPSYALFYQTLHERQMAFGYVAREPRSVETQDRALEQVLRQQRFDRLWPDYRLRYLVARDLAPMLRTWPGVRKLWDDGETAVFDVSTAGKSTPRPVP